MKNLNIIKKHSFVDLITNSSSELFVCDTNKSLEMVKTIIEKIVINYYDVLEEKKTKEDIWENIFSPPFISGVDVDLSEYPDQEDIETIDYRNSWGRKFDYEKERAARERVKKHFYEKNGIEYIDGTNFNIDTAIEYMFNLKKDDILLLGATDNSVPFELWEQINTVLNARNHHLG